LNPLSLHDALPISICSYQRKDGVLACGKDISVLGSAMALFAASKDKPAMANGMPLTAKAKRCTCLADLTRFSIRVTRELGFMADLHKGDDVRARRRSRHATIPQQAWPCPRPHRLGS